MSTSAAMRLRYPSVSNTVVARMPHSPASMRRQLSSRVVPSAVTSPMPVMATRVLMIVTPSAKRVKKCSTAETAESAETLRQRSVMSEPFRP